MIFQQESDVWPGRHGYSFTRKMFTLCPKRAIEDVFMNSYNPTITKLVCCNTNVIVGMNGRSVFYVTGYNVKSQQKEERSAFEEISKVMVKALKNQEAASQEEVSEDRKSMQRSFGEAQLLHGISYSLIQMALR